ncbi:MAG: hypothetical protein WC602_00880, partial [archaeon]
PQTAIWGWGRKSQDKRDAEEAERFERLFLILAKSAGKIAALETFIYCCLEYWLSFFHGKGPYLGSCRWLNG